MDKTKGGMYHPNGDLQGDTKGMPDKGTGTGLNGDTYGANISGDATNSQGSFSGDSDATNQLPQRKQ